MSGRKSGVTGTGRPGPYDENRDVDKPTYGDLSCKSEIQEDKEVDLLSLFIPVVKKSSPFPQ